MSYHVISFLIWFFVTLEPCYTILIWFFVTVEKNLLNSRAIQSFDSCWSHNFRRRLRLRVPVGYLNSVQYAEPSSELNRVDQLLCRRQNDQCEWQCPWQLWFEICRCRCWWIHLSVRVCVCVINRLSYGWHFDMGFINSWQIWYHSLVRYAHSFVISYLSLVDKTHIKCHPYYNL